VRQGILRREDVRESLDEQLVLDILIDCLIDPVPNSGTRIRDSFYDYVDKEGVVTEPTEESAMITTAIEVYGREQIERDFIRVYDAVREVMDAQADKFSALIGAGSGGRSPRYFHAVFMAFYDLIVRKRMRVVDPVSTAGSLRGIGQRGILSVPGGGGDWQRDTKSQSSNAVMGVIQGGFEPVKGGGDLGRYSWASELETLLGNARVEQQLFDCKQGFVSLGPTREFDTRSLQKMCRTLTGMANMGPGHVGYVAVGIADDADDAAVISRLDGVEPITYRGFRIVGIAREAAFLGRELNDYWHDISQKFQAQGLEAELAASVKSESRIVSYRGLVVALLKVRAGDRPFFFDGKIPERSQSDTVDVDPSDYKRIYERFV
jgi:hypothetical protein